MSQPPDAPPPPYGGYAQTWSLAVVALVLGVAWFFTCGLLVAIPAFMVGRNAQRQIDASGGHVQGRGMATAGIVLGIVNVVLSVLAIIAVVLAFVFGGIVQSGFSSTCKDVTTGHTVDC
jgi:hypothetical protein